MKKRYYTILLIVFGALTISFGTDPNKEITSFVAVLEKAQAYNLEVLEAMPEKDMSFKPTEEVRSFAAQMYHVGYSVKWYNEQFNGTPIKWEPGDEDRMSKQELKDLITKAFDATINLVKAQNSDNQKLIEGLIGLLDHNSHHRGQAVVYLRLKGIEPPAYR